MIDSMGSVSSIETFSTVDGPGIRTVVFLNGCRLRCIYCHNPEMWQMSKKNMTVNELVDRIVRNKDYFGESGGVTFSGGEPLLQQDFLIKVCKKLKKYGIHIALDTAGVGLGNYEKLLKYIDLIIFDVKHVNQEGYKKVTRIDTVESLNFIKMANQLNKDFWIRQVIVPGIMDNHEYLIGLKEYLKNIKNIKKIEFLPYHKLGSEKYEKLNLKYYCKDIPEMDKEACKELYKEFCNMI